MIKRRKIAVFAIGWAARIFEEYLRGISKAFEDAPTDIFVFLNYANASGNTGLNDLELNINSLPDLHDYDAAIIFANSINIENVTEELVDRCHEAGIPVICHGVDMPGTMDVIAEGKNAMYELCSHLYSKHDVKRVVILAGDNFNADSIERVETVKEFFRDHNLPEHDIEVTYTNWSYPDAVRIATSKAKAGNVPDAFICVNDIIAMSVVLALKDCGVNVPKDVIVTGFDYLYDGRVFYPGIASVDQHFDKIGEMSGKMIKKKLSGKKIEDIQYLKCSFISSESCGCRVKDSCKQLRREAHAGTFKYENEGIYFDGKTANIAHELIRSHNFGQLRENLGSYITMDHSVEGDTFFVCINPEWFNSAESVVPTLPKDGHPDEFEVIVSIKDGKPLNLIRTSKNVPVPGIRENDENHTYILLPIHDYNVSVGYMVFADTYAEIGTQFTRKYRDRFCNSLERYSQDLKLEFLNRQLSALAQTDILTKVKNRIAFEEAANKIPAKLAADRKYSFGYALFDVNYLKRVNDKCGHDAGDNYLRNCCMFICNAFKHSPVYRIGGDEFLAILEGDDLANSGAILKEMFDTMSNLAVQDIPLDQKISIAGGIAIYDKQTDQLPENVFKRADAEMYRCKKHMKRNHVR